MTDRYRAALDLPDPAAFCVEPVSRGTSTLDAYLDDDDARAVLARQPSPNPERPDETLLDWCTWQRAHGRSIGRATALAHVRRAIVGA